MQRVDCHCHTHHSDGSLSVADLLKLAKEKGLHGLSITDHDTLAAYQTAPTLAAELELELISGIEISAEYQKYSIHVLGFAFDLQHTALHEFCATLQLKRQQRNEAICQRLTECGLPLSFHELSIRFPEGSIGRPHIAKLLVEKGLIKSTRQAFERYLSNQGRCYIPGLEVGVEHAIDLIHQAGGLAVLAHPHLIRPLRIIPTLCEMPFDGIEAYYSHTTLAQAKPWLDLASKKNWIITGGSDFHSPQKNYIALGCAFTPPEYFTLLQKRFLQNNSALSTFSASVETCHF